MDPTRETVNQSFKRSHTADLPEISIIAVFHANIRNPMMREKLRAHTVANLEDLWTMADQCARVEEAASFPPRGVR